MPVAQRQTRPARERLVGDADLARRESPATGERTPVKAGSVIGRRRGSVDVHLRRIRGTGARRAARHARAAQVLAGVIGGPAGGKATVRAAAHPDLLAADLDRDLMGALRGQLSL